MYFAGKRYCFIVLILIALVLAVEGPECDAKQDSKYPNKTITLISPWPAGTSNDNFTRAIAPQLQKEIGAPMEVITKPGGSGITGTLEVLKSPRDGYTLLIDSMGTSSIPMAWDKETPYRDNDRTYICRAVALPLAIFVRGDAPWKTLLEVKDAIVRDPASFRWPSCGITIGEVPMAFFRAELKAKGVDLAKVKIVPFQGGAQALTALAGGHADMYAATLAASGSFLSAGKIKALAVTSPQPIDTFKGVPTTAEQGYPKILAQYWIGFSGPPGLPAHVVQKWSEAIKVILGRPENKPLFEKLGTIPSYIAGEDFKKFVIQEIANIKASSLK